MPSQPVWLYQGNIVYDITDTDCREQNGCVHDFLTFRHKFLTKRVKNWVKNCCVLISNSTPTGMAHNACLAWFSFNINTWISPNDSTLFHFTNVGGTTLMSSCEPEFTQACIHAHRHALTSHHFVQLNQKCSFPPPPHSHLLHMFSMVSKIIIIMYFYHALINALSAQMIHITLNIIFYTHVEHLPKQFT